MSKRFLEFGPYYLDTISKILLRDGASVSLTPKAYDILALLVEHRDRVVGKSELMQSIWPDCFVEERNLAQNIFTLRKALSEREGQTVYIETIPKRGYRFVANVSETDEPPARGPQAHSTSRLEETATQSIVVLPFRLFNFNESEQYFGAGVADALITRLSRLRQIVVRPTSAGLKYIAASQDAAAIGRQLGVEWVLEGSVQRLGDKVRVTAQLVRANDDSILWADRFDENLTDIFKLEDHISRRVITGLSLQLTFEESRQLAKNYTESAEAYQLYMKGRYAWNKRTLDGFNKGIEYFNQAIGVDPNYALAYAGLADTYMVLASYSLLPASEHGPKAKAAAIRALAIDELLAEAHASMGFIQTAYEWNWEVAEKEFKRAIALSPNYAMARHWYGLFLLAMGHLDDAIAEVEIAQRLDPLSLIINNNLGWALYFAHRYDRAIEQLTKVIELEPGFWRPYHDLAWCYLQKGMVEQAIALLSRGRRQYDFPAILTALGRAYAMAGARREALKILDELKELSEHRYLSPYYMAEIYLGIGDQDQMIKCLESAFAQRVWFLIFLNRDPMFHGIRADRRFKNLVRRMRLPAQPS